ncbi:dymeclin [Amyelois transitella]|uniref:dymeclin n=1 Tax=Amyelois transitella TaxID=680683 RepID=UPI00067AB2DA|nr:dymeclin [Amyelois transitella]XP_060808689.1 dymeclin [Amyelois transitella]
MGVAISRYAELSSNELLARFCSSEVICANDPFWNQLLAFNINPPSTTEEQLIFDSSTEALLQKFLQSNPQTGNLGSLVQVFITRATELLASPNSDNVMLAWQTFNALFVIRAVSKYLVEIVPECELTRHLDVQAERRPLVRDNEATPDQSVVPHESDSPKMNGSESKVEVLIDALIGLIIDIPVTDNTYYLHLECINTLLVLMSVYMFASVHGQTRLIETSLIYRTLFQGRYGMHAPLLVKTLIINLSNMSNAPLSMFGTANPGGSLLINIASGLWNILTFNSATHNIYTLPPVDRRELAERLKKEHPVANQSCLLLLALANHCMNDDNLYRKALLCCEDTNETSATTPQRETNSVTQITPPKVDMNALHKALCATAGCEHSTLLLYLMLHSCKAYKRHVSADPHIENLIVPILQVLYNAPDSNSHHIYMSLIVLLILTEDDALIKNVHLIMIKNPVWYTERSISEISVGGLMVLVLVRALQYNMARVRDKYLHTNCLAAIANMSCEFRNLHPYVAQRLVSLFETLTKRRAKLLAEIEELDNLDNVALPHSTEEKTEEMMDHIGVLDEVLRMLLEIINSCLTHQLVNNLNVVYALLHKRQLFTQHEHHITQNIEMVIGYFSSRLQRVQDGAGGDLGVSEVLACIKKGAEQWSSDRLKKFPDLKFRYVEEDRPEEFFTPYVWTLISNCGSVYWASECANMLAC